MARELNAALSRFARGKQLSACRAAFASGVATGAVDAWSHAILINAHATCGDTEGATAALAAMRAAGHRPCVMSYTAALKAPCAVGDLALAKRLLTQMERDFTEQANERARRRGVLHKRAIESRSAWGVVGGGAGPPRGQRSGCRCAGALASCVQHS